MSGADRSSWPLFALRGRTARLELRYPTDLDLEELARVAAAGVHDPATMPFTIPWTDAPPGMMERGLLQYHWGARASLRPEDWNLEFVVAVDGRIVGAQGIRAAAFAKARTVVTGSWLGRAHQGRGFGREMRSAILDLAFHELGAGVALSGAFVHNAASRRVSEALGYRVVGTDLMDCRGVPREHLQLRLDRADWLARPTRARRGTASAAARRCWARSRVAARPRSLALVLEWAMLHRLELRADWERARQGLPLAPIAPLE